MLLILRVNNSGYASIEPDQIGDREGENNQQE